MCLLYNSPEQLVPQCGMLLALSWWQDPRRSERGCWGWTLPRSRGTYQYTLPHLIRLKLHIWRTWIRHYYQSHRRCCSKFQLANKILIQVKAPSCSRWSPPRSRLTLTDQSPWRPDLKRLEIGSEQTWGNSRVFVLFFIGEFPLPFLRCLWQTWCRHEPFWPVSSEPTIWQTRTGNTGQLCSRCSCHQHHQWR